MTGAMTKRIIFAGGSRPIALLVILAVLSWLWPMPVLGAQVNLPNPATDDPDERGAQLVAAVNNGQEGDKIKLAPGTWRVPNFLNAKNRMTIVGSNVNNLQADRPDGTVIVGTETIIDFEPLGDLGVERPAISGLDFKVKKVTMINLPDSFFSESSYIGWTPDPDPSSLSGNLSIEISDSILDGGTNLVDLAGPVNALHFAFGPQGYTLTASAGVLDPDFGPEVTFIGDPTGPFPIDDDTEEVSLPFNFPYQDQVYSSVFVNSDGNITFGEGDFASTPRDPIRLVSGPPRIAPFLKDIALGFGIGSVHAKVLADKVVVTWLEVPTFDGFLAVGASS